MKKVIVMSLLLGGCGKIYTYELGQVIKQCKGAENVHSLWIDGDTTRAICLDGSSVKAK
jgi:hypothetical protein